MPQAGMQQSVLQSVSDVLGIRMDIWDECAGNIRGYSVCKEVRGNLHVRHDQLTEIICRIFEFVSEMI